MKKEVNKVYAPSLELEKQEAVHEPLFYQVYLHNDDYTPMAFVVDVLERYFFMDRRQATTVMLEAHLRERALCGTFTHGIAETKVAQIIKLARSNEFPLYCSMEAAR